LFGGYLVISTVLDLIDENEDYFSLLKKNFSKSALFKII
jgi:hypothetical protein